MFKLYILSCLVIFTTFVNFDRVNGHSVGNYEQEINRIETLEQEDHQLGLNHTRSKRALHNFYNVIKCVINNCDPFAYNNHGCYCGLGGSGEPIDEIDRCCQIHDKCYGDTKCPVLVDKLRHYHWKCKDSVPVCSYKEDIKHEDLSCGQQLCKCDRDFALCQQRNSCPSMDNKKECPNPNPTFVNNFRPSRVLKTATNKILSKIAPLISPEKGIWSYFTSWFG